MFDERLRSPAIGIASSGATMTTQPRHVRHVHAGWPAPYTGVIAAAVFGFVVIGYVIWLILRG